MVIAVQLALGIGFLVARLSAPVDESSASVEPSYSAQAYAQMQGILTSRGVALTRRSKAAFLAGIDPASTAFRATQERLYDNLGKLPFSTLSYVLDSSQRLRLPAAAAAHYGAAHTYVGLVQFTSALTGFDLVPSVEVQYLTFVQRGTRWYLAADSDLDSTDQRTTRGLWDLAPIDTLTSENVAVVYAPDQRALAAQCLAAAQRAVRRVAAVWSTGWTHEVVIIVPEPSMVAQLTSSGSDLTQIAAMTTAETTGAGGPPTGTRVVINPPAFRTLSRFGADVLLTHEITHVAARRTTSQSTPLWLAEGFADYVGYLSTGLSARSVARELAADLAAGRPLGDLPLQSDFDGSNPRLASTYQKAWLACRLIAARAGQAGLIRFYRMVSEAGTDPDTATATGLREVLGMTTPQFVAAWQSYVRAQLTPPRT
ncbi:hypothetical protein GCM10009765_61320 [Fodinicola feengrottensis]|uniref:Peptidase MA-like domain-containing protein n=1 Tax=Fodinicola feengrottensis TaxID=435914 RepID=A0ABN2IF22_9ACTN